MELELRINGVIKSLDVAPNESLMTTLRNEGYFSVKHGCETGECGACTVLVDGVPRPSCVTLAAQTGGCTLTTVESLGTARQLHPLQEAFIDTGAIQCGFCTPGMLLSAYALLKRNPRPTEEDVRDALSGNLCRCTGYLKPVQAVLRAAAIMRGETPAPLCEPVSDDNFQTWNPGHSISERSDYEVGQGQIAGGMHNSDASSSSTTLSATATLTEAHPTAGLNVVGKAVRKVDAFKLAAGKPVFVDDIELRGMLSARILT